MKPIEVFTGNWGVDDGGVLVVSGLRSKRAAVIWINRFQRMNEATRAVHVFDHAQ